MGFKLDRFLGLIPRAPASLLPEFNATAAQNCDFAYGELRNTRGDFNIKQLANTPRSIYTDNGLTFYSWTNDVDAVRSPLASDQFDRLYYTTPTDFRVTSRAGMTINGGEPASSYRAGVPRPTIAPKLTISPDSPLLNANITATFHYEYSGVKYQEQVIAIATVTALSKWTYTPPASNYVEPAIDKTTGKPAPLDPSKTPAQAIPVLRITAKNKENSSLLLDVYTSNSSLNTMGGWILSASKEGTSTAYSVTLAVSEDEADKETRAYTFTLVNSYNEEGPPSPPSTVTANRLLPIDLAITLDDFGNVYAPFKEIRIYRTSSGSNDADFYYAGAVIATGEKSYVYKDKTLADGLNEAISSTSAYPPNPLLSGLMALPNGILMAWRGNEVHFSDPYRPWSWPPEYVLTFPDVTIVGAVAVGSGALVTTTGKPFIISGISPDSMTYTHINLHQAGVSKWAMADLGGMVIYASHDGLNAISGNQPSLEFSGRYFTRDVWRERYGSGLDSMRFAVWDGRLIVYSSAGSFTPFMISLDEAAGQMTELPALTAACSFTSPLSDQCYYCRGSTLYQFSGGDDARALWASREIVLTRPQNFGVMQAVCTGLWTIKVYADGALKHTEANITGTVQFRLPSGFRSDRWMIQIEGTGRFRELRVASTAQELQTL